MQSDEEISFFPDSTAVCVIGGGKGVITPTFSVGFVDNISSTDYKYYMSKLGLVESKKVEWKAGVKTVFNQTARELPELRAEVNVADLF